MTSEELLYSLALRHIPKVGDITAKKLIIKFGSAKKVFEASEKDISKHYKLNKEILKALKNPEHLSQAQKEIDFMNAHQISQWGFQDEDYPPLLKHCADAPTVLFYKGKINFKNKRIISLVGTRKITPYGQQFLECFFKELQAYNPIIVSGFAYGVDIKAQQLAIKHGLQTVGTLAHNLSYLYPDRHVKYAKDIMNHGGFISDFWSKDAVSGQNFVSRNRIIAGVSQATIVIESAKKGGALITANMANAYNREVFAVPGRTFDTYSIGCNDLIKNQKAILLTGVNDLIEHLLWKEETKNPSKEIQKALFVELNKEEQQIVDYISEKGISAIDVLSKACQISVSLMASILLQLELKGVIRPLPGKMFELL